MTDAIEIPKRLYQHRPVDVYTSDIFCRRKLWFSRPGKLNDPYDCFPKYVTEIDRDGYRSYLEERLRSQHSAMSDEEFHIFIEQLLEKEWPFDQSDVERFVQEHHQRVQSIGIYCASERFDSVVMWSHYADHHRGICIEIDPARVSSGITFHPVEYRAERPVINLFLDWKHANRIAASTKNYEWAYEQEWRLSLEPPDKTLSFPCEVDLPEGMITSVILGARMNESDKNRVRDWCNLLMPSITLYRAQLNEDRFLIDRVADDGS